MAASSTRSMHLLQLRLCQVGLSCLRSFALIAKMRCKAASIFIFLHSTCHRSLLAMLTSRNAATTWKSQKSQPAESSEILSSIQEL